MISYQELLAKVDRNEEYDVIVVEGVVGVGKTVLMEILADYGYEKYEEPVVDNPILDRFYYDRKRFAFPLQVFFLNKRFEHIKKAKQVEKAVMDRSIYGDAIFARLLNLTGDMSDEEFAIYQELLENMLEHVKRPKLMIYLEISVDEALRRIQKRGRDYEQVVERSYWEALNQEYRRYFDEYDLSPLLKINVDKLDFEHSEEDRDYVLKLIEEALSGLL